MLTIEDVKKISSLAKIRLTEEEEKKFLPLLSQALDFVEVLNELKLDGVLPTSQVTGLENVWREDRVEKSLSQDQAVLNAKDHKNGYITTSQVVVKEDL